MRIWRRQFLASAAATGMAIAAAVRPMQAADAEVVIDASRPGPGINPHLYGHFMEHLGHLRRHLGRTRLEDSQRRRHPHAVHRRHEAHRRAESPLARRLFCRRLSLAGRHRRPRGAPSHRQLLGISHAGGAACGGDQRVRPARIHAAVPPRGRRAVSRGQCGLRHAARVSRLGLVQQRARGHALARGRARDQRQSRTVRREILGRRQRVVGLRRQHDGRRIRDGLPPVHFAMSPPT
jgi:hypothetical protein